MYSYYNSCFLNKDCSCRNNYGIRLYDADLKHCHERKKNRCSCYSFRICSGIPELALRILEALIGVFSIYSWHMTLSQLVL